MTRPLHRSHRYLHDHVVIVRHPGFDAYHEPLSATPETEATVGRFEFDRHRVVGPTGEEVLCDGIVFLPPEVALSFDDVVRFAGRDWRIMQIDRIRALRRDSHLEVHVA